MHFSSSSFLFPRLPPPSCNALRFALACKVSMVGILNPQTPPTPPSTPNTAWFRVVLQVGIAAFLQQSVGSETAVRVAPKQTNNKKTKTNPVPDKRNTKTLHTHATKKKNTHTHAQASQVAHASSCPLLSVHRCAWARPMWMQAEPQRPAPWSPGSPGTANGCQPANWQANRKRGGGGG